MGRICEGNEINGDHLPTWVSILVSRSCSRRKEPTALDGNFHIRCTGEITGNLIAGFDFVRSGHSTMVLSQSQSSLWIKVLSTNTLIGRLQGSWISKLADCKAGCGGKRSEDVSMMVRLHDVKRGRGKLLIYTQIMIGKSASQAPTRFPHFPGVRGLGRKAVFLALAKKKNNLRMVCIVAGPDGKPTAYIYMYAILDG